jgi:large conductance mechanosensitive channel
LPEEEVKPKLRQRARARTKDEFSGFVEFIRTQGVVGLAIGFVIGTQAKTLVDQLTASFVNPILGLIVGTSQGLSNKTFSLTIDGNTANFTWGAFVYALINFLVIAAIIYFTFRWLKLDKLDKPKK